VLETATIPHSPISAIEDVADLPFVRESALRTTTPSGDVVRLPPPAVGVPHLEEIDRDLSFPPAYGEHTDAVLAEAGFTPDELAGLRQDGVIA
jgi:crotonobetainyl-CoA:carnitine CoA-transferase CaiB-like acyl-CoA transferase